MGLVIDIGEDLVGAYLREVIGCPLVQFNVRTGTSQGEIDVVGLKLKGAQVAEVWLCEVSTHTGGLGGYKGDAPGKIKKKVASVKAYADATYPDVPRHIEVWSPKVTAGMHARLVDIWQENPDVSLVTNAEYASRVRELSALAKVTTAYRDSPSFRLLQILTRLPENPLS